MFSEALAGSEKERGCSDDVREEAVEFSVTTA